MATIENQKVTNCDGNVAGITRKQTEKELGHTVISSGNYLEGLEVDGVREGNIWIVY